jgi:hypothetical protein
MSGIRGKWILPTAASRYAHQQIADGFVLSGDGGFIPGGRLGAIWARY